MLSPGNKDTAAHSAVRAPGRTDKAGVQHSTGASHSARLYDKLPSMAVQGALFQAVLRPAPPAHPLVLRLTCQP